MINKRKTFSQITVEVLTKLKAPQETIDFYKGNAVVNTADTLFEILAKLFAEKVSLQKQSAS